MQAFGCNGLSLGEGGGLVGDACGVCGGSGDSCVNDEFRGPLKRSEAVLLLSLFLSLCLSACLSVCLSVSLQTCEAAFFLWFDDLCIELTWKNTECVTLPEMTSCC